MATSLGTSTNAQATAYSGKRKIVKSSSGRLLLFINGGSKDIKYKTSTDNGSTWDVSWTTALTHSQNLSEFDVYIDSNDDIYIAFVDAFDGYAKFIELVYSSADIWTPGSVVDVDTSGSTAGDISITKRSNGDVWIGGFDSSFFNAYYSSDLSSWTKKQFNAGTILTGASLIPKGSNIWCIITNNGNFMRYAEYTTSWSALTTIDTSVSNANKKALGVGKVSDSAIYASVMTSSGIKVFYYNGSSWDSGTLLSDNSLDESPGVSIVAGQPVVYWSDWDGSQFDIAFRNYNGSSWESQTEVTNDAAKDTFSTGLISNSVSQLNLCWTTGSGSPWTIYYETIDIVTTFEKTILSDTKIKVEDIQKTITSDAFITYTRTKTIVSDATIKVIGYQEDILSDAKIVERYQEDILSDAHIKQVGAIETILSDAKIAIEVTEDTNNKINTVKQILADVENKFNSAIRVLSNIGSQITFTLGSLFDTNNDIRTKKLINYNTNNDIRFLKSWQIPGVVGVQSLGKEYIKVYIDSIEITDVNINSINIYKAVNSTHIANLELSRKYDASAPSLDDEIEIKYNEWILYKGYITSVVPTETTEKIIINCQGKFWKQNKGNKYFHVGHKLVDETELYYDTIQEAIQSEFSWNLDIANFVPQTIDCFGIAESECLTNLITNSGNYGWFYDIDGTKKLWKAGEGSIINLNRQELGSNIKLYDVISHQSNTNVSSIVNKLRVQMGEKIVRTDENNNRQYGSYSISHFTGFAFPNWDSDKATFAIGSSSGYGIDYHKLEDSDDYNKVYKEFSLPVLARFEEWSDILPPKVTLHSSPIIGEGTIGGNVLGSPYIVGELRDGFTIDYEKGLIIINDISHLVTFPSGSDITAISNIKRPIIRVHLTKRKFISMTDSPGDDPETDIPNDLVFFTNKVGSYSDTVLKILDFSGLSVQEGGSYYDADNNLIIIPSWNDTEFAEDYSYWQLSNSAYPIKTMIVNITLDTLCFYNINLTNRIYIEGITNNAMNIKTISYNMNSFIVTLKLEEVQKYKRTVSLPYHGGEV